LFQPQSSDAIGPPPARPQYFPTGVVARMPPVVMLHELRQAVANFVEKVGAHFSER
jgi:hypothetical protein